MVVRPLAVRVVLGSVRAAVTLGVVLVVVPRAVRAAVTLGVVLVVPRAVRAAVALGVVDVGSVVVLSHGISLRFLVRWISVCGQHCW